MRLEVDDFPEDLQTDDSYGQLMAVIIEGSLESITNETQAKNLAEQIVSMFARVAQRKGAMEAAGTR